MKSILSIHLARKMVLRIKDYWKKKTKKKKTYKKIVEFDIRIMPKEISEGYHNIAFCNPSEGVMYIRKPAKGISDYIMYSIEIINHEFMHYLLYKEIDKYVSYLYHNIFREVEERKLFINSEIYESMCYRKR